MVIGRIGGCRLRIHWLLLPVLAAAALLGQLPLFLMALGVVIIHELCHTAVAALCGFHVEEIELLPVGCTARIDGLFAINPRTEAAIALAGPVSNLLLVMALTTMTHYGLFSSAWMEQLIRINLTIGLFNLLPGLPMDGGRVVRAALAREMGLSRATKLASWLGFFCGLGLVGWSVILFVRGSAVFMPGIAGIFLMILSLRERRTAPWLMLREVSGKKDALLKAEVMPVRQIVASSSLPLGRLVRRFVPHRYHLVLVVNENCAPVGSVSESQVMDALMSRGAMSPVGALVYRSKIKMVDPTAV